MHRRHGCELQSLEKRLLFAAAPASPRAETLGAAFDATERQTLLSRLTHLDSATRTNLQNKLNSSPGAFDTALLAAMQSQPAHFFFDPSDVASDASFIKTNNISYSGNKSNADAVSDSHLFPDQTNATSFTVQLPTNINWTDTSPSSNPEFLHALNRQSFWVDLAWSAAIDGNSKYANELAYELASWSQQYTTLGTPTSWSASDQDGWLLDSSIRAENWVYTYETMLTTSGFSAAEDSLFLYKIVQEGDFLYTNATTTTDFGSNRDVSLAKGLLYLAETFPEIDNASTWASAAQTLLFKCMDKQFFTDGAQVEQSPGYTANVADDLLGASADDRFDQRRQLASVVRDQAFQRGRFGLADGIAGWRATCDWRHISYDRLSSLLRSQSHPGHDALADGQDAHRGCLDVRAKHRRSV